MDALIRYPEHDLQAKELKQPAHHDVSTFAAAENRKAVRYQAVEDLDTPREGDQRIPVLVLARIELLVVAHENVERHPHQCAEALVDVDGAKQNEKAIVILLK